MRESLGRIGPLDGEVLHEKLLDFRTTHLVEIVLHNLRRPIRAEEGGDRLALLHQPSRGAQRLDFNRVALDCVRSQYFFPIGHENDDQVWKWEREASSRTDAHGYVEVSALRH